MPGCLMVGIIFLPILGYLLIREGINEKANDKIIAGIVGFIGWFACLSPIIYGIIEHLSL
jgi:hypothetical protein